MTGKEDLLSATTKPSEQALHLHPLYKGEVQMMPKCPIRTPEDFSIWYTPVAAVCKAVQSDPELVYEHTNRGALDMLMCEEIIRTGTD